MPERPPGDVIDQLLRGAIADLADQSPTVPEPDQLERVAHLELFDREVRAPRDKRPTLAFAAAAGAVVVALIGVATLSNRTGDDDVAESVPSATVSTEAVTPEPPSAEADAVRDALQTVATAIRDGDVDGILAAFAADAELSGNGLAGTNVLMLNDGRTRHLDVPEERDFFIIDLRQIIALNATPTVRSCAGQGTVTCDWTLTNDLFRPAAVDDSVRVSIELGPDGLITSWTTNPLTGSAAELLLRFYNTVLFDLDADLSRQCFDTVFEGDECLEFVSSGVAAFWDLNSAATAEQRIREFAKAVAEERVDSGYAMLNTFFRPGDAMFGFDVLDGSTAELARIGGLVDRVDVGDCRSSMDAGRRVSVCDLSVVSGGRTSAVTAEVVVVDGEIFRWAE